MRSRIPSDPSVLPAPIPYLGTSWVDRGAAYWWRRLVYALRWLLFCTMAVIAFGAAFSGFTEDMPRQLRLADIILQIVAAPVLLVAGWVVETRNRRRKPAPTPEEAWQQKEWGGARRRQPWVRWLTLPAMLLLPALVAYAIGEVLPRVLSRRFPSEIGARRDYEERLAEARSRVPLRKKHH